MLMLGTISEVAINELHDLAICDWLLFTKRE